MPQPKIYPVVIAVPQTGRELSGKAQVDFLKEYAREAVARSASVLGFSISAFETNERGAPLPADGIHWSLSHKPAYVAGVAANHPIGIDVEKIRPINKGLFARVIDASERRLLAADEPMLFFRFWTAKEVVLKRVGIGIAGLSKCRVRQVIDDYHLSVDYDGAGFMVAQTFFDDHIAAVLKAEDETIDWQFV